MWLVTICAFGGKIPATMPMFSSDNNKNKPGSRPSAQHYKPGHAICVKTADELLKNRHHQQILAQIRELSLLDEPYYTACYDNLIRRFVEYVQLLPAKVKGPLSGLLNESLFNAFYNLKELVAEKKDQADPLFRYAVFSAGLLRRSAFVVERFKVTITNEEGVYIQDWNAFDGTMCELGATYYKLFPMGLLLTGNHQALTGMIVRLLMPKEGFDWIAGDLELFHEWLTTLEIETHVDGRVGKALSYIRRDEGLLFQALPEVVAEMVETPYSTHGEAFYSWLRRGLQDGSIKVNSVDAFIHRVNNGLFVEYPGLIREFVTKVYAVPVNFNVVFEQFGNMFGLVKLSGQDYRNRQFFSDYPEMTALHPGIAKNTGIMSRPVSSIRQGMVIENIGLIYPEGNTPAVSKHLRAADRHPVKLNALPNLERVVGNAKRKGPPRPSLDPTQQGRG
jgi:hypothetical protein